MKETWAFKEQKVLANEKNYFNKLPDTVFLNMDALVYDLKKDIWNDYMQSESEEVKRLGDNINNVVLKFQVKDNDGKETIDYYRMKPVYEYSLSLIHI